MRAFVTRLLLFYGLTIGVVFAAPLHQVKGGKTTIYLSDDMVSALTDCRLERVKPAELKPDLRRIGLKIVGGALDSTTLSGEVAHNGGIAIVCWGMGTESVVEMQNFLFDTLQETPQITALVTVDDGETERIPVLLPGGELDVDVSGEGNQVRIRKIQLMLTGEAVAILENLLVIPKGNILGSAWSRIALRGPDKPGNSEGKTNGNVDKNLEEGEDKDDDNDDDEEGSGDD